MGQKKETVFDKILKLTVEDLGAEVVLPKFGRKKAERWGKLFEFWMHHISSSGGDGILYPVLHKIHWGVYPDPQKQPHTPEEYSERLLEIFCILEDTIRNDKKECPYIMDSDLFGDELYAVRSMQTPATKRGTVCYSPRHVVYLMSLFEKVVNGGKGTPYPIDEELPYEKLVIHMLPEAVCWTTDEWQTESKIFEGLKNNYDMDYFAADVSYIGEDYDALLQTLDLEWLEQDPDCSYVAIFLRTMSMKMARLIWQDTEKKVVELFLSAVDAVKAEVQTRESLEKSWLHQQSNHFASSGKLQEVFSFDPNTVDRVRRNCFDLAMGAKL